MVKHASVRTHNEQGITLSLHATNGAGPLFVFFKYLVMYSNQEQLFDHRSYGQGLPFYKV